MDGEWWRGGVLYQIIPRSFQDADGDGIGDLRGILGRLDHVAQLGVDAVWISPFYASPMADFGYDVADHCAVDPVLGTLADIDAVIARAHLRGLKILVDLVWSHSSDRHPWFEESRRSRRGGKADWYVWADPKADGGPPNNWLSVFGGSAWTWEPRRGQYYLHHFLASQPALNLWRAEVVEALEAIAEFWLGRGVDGFRLDAVDFLLHDPLLRDNPARPWQGGAPPLKPFGFQDHLHDMAQPEAIMVMRRLRRLLSRHPGATSVAEVSSETGALRRANLYTAGDEHLHMAYTLRLMRRGFSAEILRTAIREVAECFAEGWICWAFSNHDVPRAVSRWGDGSPAFARLLMALLLSLRGSVCLYQGEELGLPEADIPFAALQDPYGKAFWPAFKGRDGSRTPMPWAAGEPHAGFSRAAPWLPIPAAHVALAVDRQEDDPASMLRFTGDFLAWRKGQAALRCGDIRLLAGGGDVLAFERRQGDEAVLCLFNCGPDPVELPGQAERLLAAPAGGAAPSSGGLALPGWGFAYLAG